MGLKVYSIQIIGNELTLPLEDIDKRLYVTFRRRGFERLSSLSTRDFAEQRAIEASNYFKSGRITLSYTEDSVEAEQEVPHDEEGDNLVTVFEVDEVEAPEVPEVESTDGHSYPEVKSFREAKEILNSKYDVKYADMRNSVMVLELAGALGVTFPQLEDREG